MERYFLGNNTAYGFVGNYEDELKDKSRVILFKGGPGTGKSSMLKRIAAEAKRKGFDYELWYCSGDPSSLDGVYIKDTNMAVVDATAPHATGADLPKMKDFIYDLATSLDEGKLKEHREEIVHLLKFKKHYFMRAYQHLNTALCHKNNAIALESEGLKKANIRSYAAVLAAELRQDVMTVGAHRRRLFVHAISPSGMNCYYDHLIGKKIYRVGGSDAACNIFFDQLTGLLDGGTAILNPLDAKNSDGFMIGNVAVVRDVGHLADKVYETVNLSVYEGACDIEAIEEERNNVILQVAFAEEQLNKARSMHLECERYFIGAMDFANNDRIYGEILKELKLAE